VFCLCPRLTDQRGCSFIKIKIIIKIRTNKKANALRLKIRKALAKGRPVANS
jgi:hypothetical protein